MLRPARIALLLFGLAMAVVAILAIDRRPTVAERRPPTTQEVQRARDAFRRLRAVRQQPGNVGGFTADAADLSAIAALITDARPRERVRLSVTGAGVLAEVSRALPLGLWLNASALVPPGSGDAVPRVRVGAITLPEPVTRLARKAGWGVLRARGMTLPDPGDLLRRLSIADGRVTTLVHLPAESGLMRGTFVSGDVDPDLVTRIFCTLHRRQRAEPAEALAEQMRRAAGAARDADDRPAANRAVLVALAMYVVTPRAATLTGDPMPDAAACAGPLERTTLHGRADLAKHFTLSAALAATSGDDTSRALGEWKELSDSGPLGDGFSFVDLAADRAGIRLARRATSPGGANDGYAAMTGAVADRLLPPQLLSGRAGLSEAEFVRDYGDTASPAYREAVRQIDETLRLRGS